jgi:predicted RNase H-like nuclease
MRAVGIDACRGGWVAVTLDDGQVSAVHVRTGLAEVLAECPGAAAVGLDMPLGLVQGGWRQADELAATRLGAYRSRVFRVPPRPVWNAATHREAVSLCRQLTEPPAGFSVQAWGLKEKLQQADELRARLPDHLFEVHPELSFAALNDGTPIAAGKKTWNGQMARRALLASAGIRLPGDLNEAGAVPADDILDAAAAAWSANRIASGQASSLPDPPQPDDTGRPIAIWY